MKIAFLLFLMAVMQPAFSQMHPVPAESAINFSLHNFGFKTGGRLDPPEGDIVFQPEDPASSYFRVTIKAASINTDNESRDEHLREVEYFDVKNYPDIKFVSESIRSVNNKGDFEASGKLTIKKTTRDISLPFHAEKSGTGYVFTGRFTMNRRDYGIGGSSTISNELAVDIKVTAR